MYCIDVNPTELYYYTPYHFYNSESSRKTHGFRQRYLNALVEFLVRERLCDWCLNTEGFLSIR
jgi:hypothetical protein